PGFDGKQEVIRHTERAHHDYDVVYGIEGEQGSSDLREKLAADGAPEDYPRSQPDGERQGNTAQVLQFGYEFGVEQDHQDQRNNQSEPFFVEQRVEQGVAQTPEGNRQTVARPNTQEYVLGH